MEKGNEKISFTAQAIALMRSEENCDRFSKYFVGKDIKRKFFWIKKFISDKKLRSIFQKRVALSKEIDKLVKQYNPDQIIELACGYSPRGLELVTRKKITYVETDFGSVIRNKKNIVAEILKKEKINLKGEYHLIKIDVISDDFNSILKFLDKRKKTLILSETLNSYLSIKEHNLLVKKVYNFLSNFKQSAYISHESYFGMLSGLSGRLLLFYRDRIAKTKSFSHFKNSVEIRNYFLKNGFKKVTIKNRLKINNWLYLAQLK